MTIAEFVLARIAEDEECAHHGDGGIMDHEDGARFDRSRVLAECEAKRRIVERLRSPDPHLAGEPCHDCATLYDLAIIYADHGDYDDSWRP